MNRRAEEIVLFARIEEITALQDGWLDGEGRAPSGEGLEWFARRFEYACPDNVPLPCLYPTPEGGLQVEWSIGRCEVSLDIDLGDKEAEWHSLDTNTNVAESRSMELKVEEDWRVLFDRIGHIAAGAV